ncbi:MAG TPA: helix-turn-helix domain-containing protein [Thermoanaerobaculia bacterium]|nr:helix-turn-helix domain-containing protein [Thermoanaerobaculia bacterium]
MQIGDRLREARRQRHLSLQQVARCAGISAATLSRIETSKQSLDIQLLMRVADTLGASPAEFLNGGDDPLRELQHALGRLAPDARSILWATLADNASHPDEQSTVPLRNRLSEVLAQLDLLRAEVETMRNEVDGARTAGVASDAARQ